MSNTKRINERMKEFTARDLVRNGFAEALKASAAGEDVFIVVGKNRWDDQPNPSAISRYGEQVARMRFKIVVDEEVK